MHRIALGFMLMSGTSLAANPQHFASSGSRTHLLELYSSEGCSSCPPAESWLGSLVSAPGLWRDFVPVAFHVSYWDHLGWRDRFARNRYSEREYRYAAEWGSGNVYTPCFVLDGAEWRSGGAAPGAATGSAGVLTADYDGQVCRVKFAGGEGDVHVAVLGGGIMSAVAAGENEGRTLCHEFVVLELREARLSAGKAEVALTLPVEPGVRRRALAVWVTRLGEQAPRQATGGWLD